MRFSFVLLLMCGCGGGATTPTSVTFTMSTASPSIGTVFNAPVGSSASDGMGGIILTDLDSHGNQLDLGLDAAGVLLNVPINIGDRHLFVEFYLGGVKGPAWASSSTGSITFTAMSPYVVSLNAVLMQHAGSQSMGGFTLGGTAQFSP
jgi:hypothetical protein